MRDRQYIIGLKKAIEYVDSISDKALLNVEWDELPLVMLKEKSNRIYIRRGNPMSLSRDCDDYIVQLCFYQTRDEGKLAGVFFDSKFKCSELDKIRKWTKERLQYVLDESEDMFFFGYDQTGWTRFKRKYDTSGRSIEAIIEMGETGFSQRLTYPAHSIYRVIMEYDGLWDPAHYYGDFSFGLSLSEKVIQFERERMTTESIPYMSRRLLDRIVKCK